MLHDIGHGPYSHTFEHIFGTNHEDLTVAILTSPSTEVNKVLRAVAPEFPEKIASVIQKTYPNQQVVQMISSQIDADRMDYLLRDSYYTGTNYGTFDLKRILRVMRPYEKGITFHISGMHAVEDYIVSRFQMYQQVYFHPVSRSMEVILNHLLQRAKFLFEHNRLSQSSSPLLLLPFFENNFSVEDYIHLDDGVLNTYFIQWSRSSDKILSDLARRFLNRKPLKSARFSQETKQLLPKLRDFVTAAGYNSDYYTATNDSFDLPYDVYAPNQNRKKTQIELFQDDGTLVELSVISKLVAAITGEVSGDERFFFPKEMLASPDQIDLFTPIYEQFQKYLKNGWLFNNDNNNN